MRAVVQPTGRDTNMDDPHDAIGLNLHSTTDAQVWAREFCKRFAVVADAAEPFVDDQEGLMIAWFANAIETGRSAGLRAHRDPLDFDESRNVKLPTRD